MKHLLRERPGLRLILILLMPLLVASATSLEEEVVQPVAESHHASSSMHDCCPASDTDTDLPETPCTGTYFCTCSLQARTPDALAIPFWDHAIPSRMISWVEPLPMALAVALPTDDRSLHDASPPLWLRNQALLN